MVDDALKPALRIALRLHEIGDASPYVLSFAGKAKSGASFGFMQGDLAAGQPEVRDTFVAALTAAGIDDATIADWVGLLSVPRTDNPLTAAQTQQIDAALLASRALVDAMDEQILQTVYRGVDACVAAADDAVPPREVTAEAQIYAAMWINMTGPPSKLLSWLRGENPHLQRAILPAPQIVDGGAMESYLQATDYYIANPRNFRHLQECAAAGAAALPPDPAATPVA